VTSTVPADQPRWNPLDRIIVGMNALGSVWILLLILLVTTDAMSRSFLSRPIAGVTEMVQISIVGIVFMQLADAIRTGKLTRADSFLTLLRLQYPGAAHRLEAGFFALGALYMGLGLWGSVPLLVEAWRRDAYLGNEGVFTIVVWPVKAVLVLGLTMGLIEFLRQTRKAWRLVAHPEIPARPAP
jgi:TRAP-type mannitol/chloroaromatic compound transport system permease small subunit